MGGDGAGLTPVPSLDDLVREDLDAGRIALRDLWPAVVSWWRVPGGDAAGPAWSSLAAMPEWIDEGPSTPHLDAHERGDAEWLIRWCEDAPVFRVALAASPLAAALDECVALAA